MLYARTEAVRRWPRDHPLLLFGLIAVVTAVAIVALGSGGTFYHDEWTAIDRREAWTLEALIQPHNEHLSLGLAFVYKVIFEIVGMRSYLPYLVVLAALHVGVAAAVIRLALRRNGWGLALPLGLLMLLLGTGSENLYWAHQIGFVGSTACGLWALDAQQRDRWAIASFLLLVAVVTVGTGLPFVVAAITLGIFSGHRLHHVAVVVAPAIVAFAAWYLALGRTSVDIARGSSQLEALANMRDYLLTGVSHAIGSVSGLGADVGLVVAVMTVVLLVATGPSRRSWPPMTLAAIAGLLSSYAIYGVVRAQLGAEQATASRYVYVAGAFILVAVGAAPMRRNRLSHRPAAIAAGAILLAIALVVNATALMEGHAYFDEQARRTRAVAAVVLRYADAPGIDQQRTISPQPSPERLRELMGRHGRVDKDAFLPDLIPPPTLAELDAALWRIAGADFSVAATDEPMTGAAPELTGRRQTALDSAGGSGCLALLVTGTSPAVSLRLADGKTLAYSGDGAGELVTSAARLAGFSDDRVVPAIVEPGRTYLLRPPDLAEPETSWSVRLQPPAGTERWRLCLGSTP